MTKAIKISLMEEFSKLSFLKDRHPESTEDESKNSFSVLSDYRDGAIFITHYAGNSQWERHSKGDEIVYVLEGATNLILRTSDGEKSNILQSGELLVVPQNVWHRFETLDGAKILAVTPQPTDHVLDLPDFSD
ncbi:MAG: cupin domain-containing protein [Sneathiella sp.]